MFLIGVLCIELVDIKGGQGFIIISMYTTKQDTPRRENMDFRKETCPKQKYGRKTTLKCGKQRMAGGR